ncbi:Survival protein SurE-like phosphatase/nucleotidase [Corchorus olitorius]|uniref:Survival protein SurE-like phosphatase/nucleotidase n=1 Tax=Corchorus olitorius TaxID=93759 RepID=A0A1R3J9Z5_9ROSI|nr:Survival protein SurE-like phosphatase/nucleotidase [Corchorus olitorius]
MTTSVKNNFLPPSLISNLQQVLISRNDAVEHQSTNSFDSNSPALSSISRNAETNAANVEPDCSKPVVLITNGEGIDSPGLTFLVQALLADGRFNINVCAPQSDKSVAGHSVTVRETVTVCSVEMGGATAFEVSGTPVDCVSLALSGALFSWSKPVLVISGINSGSSCGRNMFYSGAVAAAREALICCVPSLCLSFNWKKDVRFENDLKDAVNVCLPLIFAAVRDIENGNFPESCLLNIEIPSCPQTNKGFKLSRQSFWRSPLSWKAVAANRHPGAGQYLSNQQSLGIRLAQLSRDASAAGAARRLNLQRKNVEIESVGVSGKLNGQQTVKKYFRLELLEKETEDADEDLDFKALEDGYVAVTPLSLSSTDQSKIETLVSNWIKIALGARNQ